MKLALPPHALQTFYPPHQSIFLTLNRFGPLNGLGSLADLVLQRLFCLVVRRKNDGEVGLVVNAGLGESHKSPPILS